LLFGGAALGDPEAFKAVLFGGAISTATPTLSQRKAEHPHNTQAKQRATLRLVVTVTAPPRLPFSTDTGRPPSAVQQSHVAFTELP
jgi:hypothetical protein